MTKCTQLMCLGIVLVVTGACGPTSSSAQVYENDESAKLCLVEEGQAETVVNGEISVAADEPLELVYGIFLTSYAERGPLVEESCSVEVDGSTLTVNSLIEFGEGSAPTGQASAAADPRFVECDVPELGEGDYEVVHGESSQNLAIPNEGNLDCDDELFRDWY